VRTHTPTQQVNWDLQKTRESVQAFGPINQEHLRVSKKTKGEGGKKIESRSQGEIKYKGWDKEEKSDMLNKRGSCTNAV
jgi:hypothetical protein